MKLLQAVAGCVEQGGRDPMICSVGISVVTADYTRQISFFLFNQHKSVKKGGGIGVEGGG